MAQEQPMPIDWAGAAGTVIKPYEQKPIKKGDVLLATPPPVLTTSEGPSRYRDLYFKNLNQYLKIGMSPELADKKAREDVAKVLTPMERHLNLKEAAIWEKDSKQPNLYQPVVESMKNVPTVAMDGSDGYSLTDMRPIDVNAAPADTRTGQEWIRNQQLNNYAEAEAKFLQGTDKGSYGVLNADKLATMEGANIEKKALSNFANKNKNLAALMANKDRPDENFYLKTGDARRNELNDMQKRASDVAYQIVGSDTDRAIAFDAAKQKEIALATAEQKIELERAERERAAQAAAWSSVPFGGLAYSGTHDMTPYQMPDPAAGPSTVTGNTSENAPKGGTQTGGSTGDKYSDGNPYNDEQPSDKTNKKDIKQISKDNLKGVNSYKFEYKKDFSKHLAQQITKDKNDQKVIEKDMSTPREGVMAQEVAKSGMKDIVVKDPKNGLMLNNNRMLAKMMSNQASINARLEALEKRKR